MVNIEYSSLRGLINTRLMNPQITKESISHMVLVAYKNGVDINFKWTMDDQSSIIEVSLYGRNNSIDSWLSNVMAMDRPELVRETGDWSKGYSGTVPNCNF